MNEPKIGNENKTRTDTGTEKLEYIPSEKEVYAFFQKLVGGATFSERRRFEDGQGLYLWEIKITQEDGGTIEYCYLRKGSYKEGSSLETVIYIAYFDTEGRPTGGNPLFKLIDNKWEEIF